MSRLSYSVLAAVDPADLLPTLNKRAVRAHLIDHPRFDAATAAEWLAGKLAVDATPGCRVRAVLVDGELAGWCGIQFENGQYELAIVLDDAHWGIGPRVFREMMGWARELGHETVCIHFLHTRPAYRFLRKMARRVHESEWLGSRFTTYELAVG